MKLPKRLVLFPLTALLFLACAISNLLPIGATSTPTITATTTPPLTPTITPTFTPTPTPLPRVKIEKGEQLLFYGDWENALLQYQSVLGVNADLEVQTAALLGIGRSYYLMGDYEKAFETLSDLVSSYPESPHTAHVYFFLAQTLDALGEPLLAAEAYHQVLQRSAGVIDSYLYEAHGDALAAGGDYLGAIQSYQQALQSPRAVRDLNIDIKIARSYALAGDYQTAIIGYQDIYNRADNDYTKAQMDLLIGQSYLALGQPEPAYQAFLDAVDNYPLAYDSYLALLTLVEAGVPVNELNRGLVDYFAGQYAVAIAAFDRYLQASPTDAATARYYKGLALSALGQHEAAIGEWDRVIQGFPNEARWDDAWEQKAYVLWAYLDRYSEAAQTLLDFVALAPTHERAAEFLFDAASVKERAGDLEEAVELWERVSAEYPGSEFAYRALFLSGITRYRLADYPASYDAFQRALSLAGDLEERAAAFLWSGKCQQALGDTAAARTTWEQAASLDPSGYYSERARDLLSNLEVFTPPLVYDLSFDPRAEQAEAEAWMRTVFSLPAEVDLSSLGELANDARLQRGNELWQLGLYPEARAEFEDLRQSLQSDPVNSYRLANHLLELGLYRSAILAMRQILTLAGMDDAETMHAPIYFNHVRFGTYFKDLVIELAHIYGFHPLFLFSLIRQESLFEGFIRSSAGARGLMQIMPNTGAEVATHAGWPPDFTADDLYRPIVSLTLGCKYLDRQRKLMNGDLYAMLAAYNAGPGNALVWKELAPNDADLFLEVIRFEETRKYIRGIYEIFNIYRNLYDRTP